MNMKFALSAMAAATLISGAAYAEVQTSAGSGAGGVSASGQNGTVAGGVAASQTRRDMRRQGRQNQQSMQRGSTQCLPGTASTSTTGSVYTDRRTGTAGIATNGTASGSGTVRSSSEGEVYSSTDRTGSQADAYGNSTAVAREPTRRC
jgi:hypothetical protein